MTETSFANYPHPRNLVPRPVSPSYASKPLPDSNHLFVQQFESSLKQAIILSSKVSDCLSHSDKVSFPLPRRSISSFKDLTEVLITQIEFLLENSYIGSERIS